MRHAHNLVLANHLLWLHSKHLAFALPEIFARQTCDSIVCVSSVDWGAVGGWIDELINKVPSGIQTLPNPDFQTTPKESLPNKDPSLTPIPDVGLFVNPSQGSKAYTKDIPSNKDLPSDDSEEEDSGQKNTRPCSGAIAQLIWSVDCQETGRNAEVGNMLFQMDPDYLTSYDLLCSTKDGVAFWQAQLTPPQIEKLREQINLGVRVVSRNSPYKFGKLTEVPSSPVKPRNFPSSPDTTEDLEPQQLFLFTESRRPFDPSLEYLSTPSRNNRGLLYVYFKTFDPKVPVYVIDTGLNLKYNGLDNIEIK